MQKGQNVTKTFIIILSFICFIKVNGQEKLEGTYCVDNKIKDISKCVSFKENNKFELYTGKHLNNKSKLSGNWSYNNDYLILAYDKSKLFESYNIYMSKSETIKDSIFLSFRVKDFNNGPALGVEIKIPNLHLNLITNQKGEIEVKLKKSSTILNGYTEYLGYEKCHFSINLETNQLIQIFINEENIQTKKHADTLKILNHNKNSFIAIDKKRKKRKWIRHN